MGAFVWRRVASQILSGGRSILFAYATPPARRRRLVLRRDPERLRAQVEACFAANPPPAEKQRFIGAVVPHAGLMYSGHVAAAFYALAELPKRFVILCPNHTGAGHFAAINREGAWRTPLGDVADRHARSPTR